MSRHSPGATSARNRWFIAPTLVLALVALASRAHATTWIEIGDAGPLPATAQATTGTGSLTEIVGNFAAPDDVDMYCIHVTDPAGFFAKLVCASSLGPDLWLFDATGRGVAMNSLCQGGAKSVTGAFLAGTGAYYLVVGYDALYPFAGANQIWRNGYTPERAPDGPGAPGVVTGWTGVVNLLPHSSPYRVMLLGAAFCDDPTPAAGYSWGQVKSTYR